MRRIKNLLRKEAMYNESEETIARLQDQNNELHRMVEQYHIIANDKSRKQQSMSLL